MVDAVLEVLAVMEAVLLTVLEEVRNWPPGGPEEVLDEVSDWKGTVEPDGSVVDEVVRVTEVDDVKNWPPGGPVVELTELVLSVGSQSSPPSVGVATVMVAVLVLEVDAVLLTVLEEVRNWPPGGPEEVLDEEATVLLEERTPVDDCPGGVEEPLGGAVDEAAREVLAELGGTLPAEDLETLLTVLEDVDDCPAGGADDCPPGGLELVDDCPPGGVEEPLGGAVDEALREVVAEPGGTLPLLTELEDVRN